MRSFLFTLLVTFSLALTARESKALDQGVIGAILSTSTFMGLTVSSNPATDIVISTAALYRQVCVQNQDNAHFVACGDSINVSSTLVSGVGGVWITTFTAAVPNLPVCFPIPQGKSFYCRSSNITGGSPITTIRSR